MEKDVKDNSHFQSSSEIVIPDHFPKVYEDEHGRTMVYLGAIVGDRMQMDIGCSPYWTHGKHSTDETVKETISGFYRLESGVIRKDNFLDEETIFSSKVAEKEEYVDLPKGSSTYFGIRNYGSHEENVVDTRQAFGLTHEELFDLLEVYGRLFGLGNAYRPYPRITRSNQCNNCCDLTHAWIPRGFPYITFDDSPCSFSHVSLGGFYEHMRLLLLHGNRSVIWRAMVDW